ncbi:MAG: alkane 1-monooxygenase [Sinobacteraceae bacterium]|nr:alkane 1-monooxygenase [Nevskiaceae bacterium]
MVDITNNQFVTTGAEADSYVDKKKYLWALSMVWPAVPLIGLYLVHLTGWGIWYSLLLLAWYIAIPLLDAVFGQDNSSPPESRVEQLEASRYYRLLPYLTVPIHYVTLIVCAWWVSTHSVNALEFVALALSVGIINGLAINTGHELGHKKRSFDRWMAKAALAVVGYGHFFIEHNKGHHRDVATPEDPATSRLGENIYVFALREIPGAAKRAWKLEKDRLARSGKSAWSLENEILQPLILTVVLYVALTVAFGPLALLFVLIQMVYGWFQLTSANYIEHYGLLRQKLPDGRYERQQPRHSWNANHIASNLILFHLQRHSDHHAHPTRSYQSLRDFPDLPSLPTGYPGMFFAAMVPPLFRHLMDRKTVAWADGDLGKLQIHPGKKAYYQRKFAA